MSNSHFELAMARGTQSDKVADDIRFILIDIVPAWVNMMDVKAATAWATFYSAALANLVAIIYQLPDVLPKAAMLQTSSAAPMGAVLANHILNSAFTRAILPPVLSHRREDIKEFSTITTNDCHVRLNAAGIGTLAGAMSNCRSHLIEMFIAPCTIDVRHPCSTPSKMTWSRAKYSLSILARSVRLALKRRTAMVTHQGIGLADSINRALTGTMINRGLISLKCRIALEACLEHS